MLVRDFGSKSLALFGSVVRDKTAAASDVDLLVKSDRRLIGLFHLSRIPRLSHTHLHRPLVLVFRQDFEDQIA